MNREQFRISNWRRGNAKNEPDIVELTRQCLARIETHDETIKAWEMVFAEEAIAHAELLQLEWKTSQSRGLLHGVPFGVKDIFDLQGFPTKAGSAWFADVEPAASDAPVVAKLRAAGAIILGKTVTTELACFNPSPTRNPYNLEHTPGGSSSGSAAAVSAEMCCAALGSQTGGSIVRPASYCGVAGWKGPLGAVSTKGVTPVSFTLDHVGPIASCAADLLTIVSVLENEDVLDHIPTEPPKFGVLRDFYDDKIEAGKVEYEAALLKLQGAGAEIVEVKLPDEFDDVLAHHWRIMAVEATLQYGEFVQQSPEKFSDNFQKLVDFGRISTSQEYEASLEHRRKLIEVLHTTWREDLIYASPSSPSPAPADLTTTGSPAFNSPWSYCGFSAVTIPSGLAENGMPTGLQLIAHPANPYANLPAAVWCEETLETIPPPAVR